MNTKLFLPQYNTNKYRKSAYSHPIAYLLITISINGTIINNVLIFENLKDIEPVA
jgi:hypothetical protein